MVYCSPIAVSVAAPLCENVTVTVLDPRLKLAGTIEIPVGRPEATGILFIGPLSS